MFKQIGFYHLFMDNKSKENWDAAMHIMNDYPNAAASRFYYSLYQIMIKYIYKFDRQNWETYVKHLTDQYRIYGTHDHLMKYILNKCSYLPFDNDSKRTFRTFQYFLMLRKKADYKNDNVDKSELISDKIDDAHVIQKFYTKKVRK